MVVAFSSLATICGECSTIHSPPALFFFFFLGGDRDVWVVEVSFRTLIPLFMQGSVHSGSASWDDCERMFPDKLGVSSFPHRFPHYARTAALSAYSDSAGSRVCACLGVTYHLHFWQNDRGILRATAVTCGWNGQRIRASTKSQIWRREFSCRSCRDSNSQSFDHESGVLTIKLSR